MHNIFTRSSSLLIIILALPLLACRQEAPPTASPNASRYDLRGKVVSFDKARQEVTIAHEAIPGYMEAMTMPFTLNEEWVFDVLTPGAQIQATLVVDGARSWIETPTVTQMSDAPESAGATPGPEPEPGAELPDFTLVNQDGEKISLQQFRGQYPVPTYVGEFLLGRYCATTDPDEIVEGLAVVERSMKERTVRAGEEELFK